MSLNKNALVLVGVTVVASETNTKEMHYSKEMHCRSTYGSRTIFCRRQCIVKRLF